MYWPAVCIPVFSLVTLAQPAINDIQPSTYHDEINLSHSSLRWLPPLEVDSIDASSNLLNQMPGISPAVRMLNLKSNAIRYANSERCPENLKVLDLSENPIKELNMECQGVEKLNISLGDVETLPEAFLSKFPSLRELYMDKNPIKKINGDLTSSTLEVLSLQSSQLRYIKPGLFAGLSKIKLINISGNKYIHTLNPIASAEFIIANHCALETVDLTAMPKLKGVEISDNHITKLTLPDSVTELKARNNLIYDINLKRIKKADLSGNSIISLGLRPMEWLNISGNPIAHLNLASIGQLDASQCKISSLQVTGSKFEYLNLSHNALEVFPSEITAKKLDVSFNRLSRFKTLVHGAEEVWLTGNRLVLAEDVTAQGRMHLGDNPWTCDCRMEHLYRSAHAPGSLVCVHPANISGMTWHHACYRNRIPRWMLERPYLPFIISIALLIVAIIFFYWLRKKLDTPSEAAPSEEEQTETETQTVIPEIRINNQLPSYEEALLMPGIARKKNALTQTRSYEVLSRRLSSNSV